MLYLTFVKLKVLKHQCALIGLMEVVELQNSHKNVVEICEENKSTFKFLYEDDIPLFKKIEKIGQEIYHASEVVADTKVRQQLKDFEAKGFGKLPVCIAKTQYSFSRIQI